MSIKNKKIMNVVLLVLFNMLVGFFVFKFLPIFIYGMNARVTPDMYSAQGVGFFLSLLVLLNIFFFYLFLKKNCINISMIAAISFSVVLAVLSPILLNICVSFLFVFLLSLIL
jgi:hypothetical protein